MSLRFQSRCAGLFLACVTLASAQGPRIGLIDFYGLRKVSDEQLRKAMGVRAGDPLPRSKSDVEEALEKVPNVVRARLEAVCCEDGKAILYVGIEEKGAPHFNYLLPPAGLVKLSQEIHDEYTAFLAAVGLAVRAGETSEDLSPGHSLMTNAGARKHQERFLDLARDRLDLLRDVLRNSVDEEHRAIAAYIIGYAPKNNEDILQPVIDDLQHALRDPDDTVRNNAMRSLGAIAVLASRKPELKIRISPTWLIEMLDSLIWTDKATAATVLLTLTERRDAAIVDHLRQRALPALFEMSRWKHLPHALPAFILVGRIAGLQEKAIQDTWALPDRSQRLERALESSGKPK